MHSLYSTNSSVMNNELESMWKEVAVAIFKVLFQH
jgi:hypothetical protein